MPNAVELTKLEIQRKLSCRSPEDSRPRPAILDFLANYRDLPELGTKSPKELYETIMQVRIEEAPAKTEALPPKS